jgi:DNA modification methylase
LAVDLSFSDDATAPALEFDGRRAHLSEEEIAAVVDALRSGQALDPRLRPMLFPATHEARLEYSQKASRGQILAETMSVPLQVQKRIGEASSEWNDKLIFGDNLQVLKRLLELKERGELRNADNSRGVRLCYIDPPFATKREFRGRRGALAYRDRVEGAQFIEYLRKRLVLIHELLTDDGVLYLHLDTNKVHYMKIVLDEIFGSKNMFAEIIWKRTSGHGDAQRWSPVHETILVYVKSQDQYVWNAPREPQAPGYEESKYTQDDNDGRGRYQLDNLTSPNPRPNLTYTWEGFPPPDKGWRYSRASMDELDADGRIYKPADKTKRPRLKRYLDENEGRVVDDFWGDIPPVNSQASDRSGYPTQKPIALLERIIAASTKDGDLVLDCFAGSGTTVVAARALGRRWIAVDSGKLAIYTIQRRLLESDSVSPFEVCQAGLYDNNLLELLPFSDFRDFALDLFGCRAESFSISGVQMVGQRRGDPVHMFPFDSTGGLLDVGYIESLHARVKSKVGRAVFVIVPEARCDPGLFEDLITQGKTTYFLLRVPYSVIEVLHSRDFKQISQPVALAQVNDALDSYGFDFIELPELKYTSETTKAQTQTRIQIEQFQRGGVDPETLAGRADLGRDDLAMVLVDPAYDGKEFRLDQHLFGDDLRAANWRFTVDHAKDTAVMLVVVDIFGNESRQVVREAGSASKKAGPSKGSATKAPRSAAARKSSTAVATTPALKAPRRTAAETAAAPASAVPKKRASQKAKK